MNFITGRNGSKSLKEVIFVSDFKTRVKTFLNLKPNNRTDKI